MTGPRECNPAEAVRHLDCANVSVCLTVAVRGKWEGMACGTGCYVAPDAFQRAMDHEGLTALRLTVEAQR